MARFLKELAQTAQGSRQRRAVARTLREWEDVAESLEPLIRQDLARVSQEALVPRAEALAYLAKKYAESPRPSPARAVVPTIRHSRIQRANDRVLVSFGQSVETRALNQEQLSIPVNNLMPLGSRLEVNPSGGAMVLPVYKVTMLGGSMTGKTVFMASMYAKLRDGSRNISIRAVDDNVDRELGEIMENLYAFNRWPPNSEFDQRQYDFELLLKGRSIACIDWVDYRGGALMEGEEEDGGSLGGSLLSERLRDSHAILWMVDMSVLTDGNLDGMKQRIQTRVARMSSLCRHAIENQDSPRAWIFIRTKADEVRDKNGSPDWERACMELVTHLGEAVQIASNGLNSRAAVLPVSATGRVDPGGSKILIDDNPFFVEWPLILSLAFLMDVEFSRSQQERNQALQRYKDARPGQIQERARSLLKLQPSKDERKAWDEANTLGSHLAEMHQVIAELLQKCPAVVKLLHNKKALI